MKKLLQPRKHNIGETLNANCESLTTNVKSKPLLPSSRRVTRKQSKENAPPLHPDPNSASPFLATKMDKSLPPRPLSRNPLKRKLCNESASDSSSSDSGVQVIVRMRPLNKDEEDGKSIVQKLCERSLAIGGQTFTFDSVADHDATQEDVFQLVGAPLVENCLAGFNSSVFAYGQTGSGKTYTMWGPATGSWRDNLHGDQQGLTPRVFQRLFARINEEQAKHAEKQMNYQCRCSFLEIYNEQITDLLDPNQKNLQIREDVKSGVYVENLREEYVFTMKDVMRLLIKGLSNRKTGSTSTNAESSRSHSVFTCVLESRCKKKADGASSLKISRINLVDLAGSERQKLTGTAGERLKEAGNINRSLSQLGNLINILAEVSQTGKQRHIPYRDSRLTFLLQESLGGNAKLAMVCAVSPSLSCQSESFSTLRFAQRAKAIKNKAVVNEEMKDDVNHLKEIIHQLRDELHRVKENGNNPTGLDLRKSLNLLKSLIPLHARLPQVDEDGDEEMEIDEDAVENTCQVSPILISPVRSCSPRMSSRKSLRTCSMLTASQTISDDENTNHNVDKTTPEPVTCLVNGTSVRKRKSISLRRSSVRFLIKPPQSSRPDADDETTTKNVGPVLCEKCKSIVDNNSNGESEIMKENCGSHPDSSTLEFELKKVQDELKVYKEFYDLGERESLLQEIQNLRGQLRTCHDSSLSTHNDSAPEFMSTASNHQPLLI